MSKIETYELNFVLPKSLEVKKVSIAPSLKTTQIHERNDVAEAKNFSAWLTHWFSWFKCQMCEFLQKESHKSTTLNLVLTKKVAIYIYIHSYFFKCIKERNVGTLRPTRPINFEGAASLGLRYYLCLSQQDEGWCFKSALHLPNTTQMTIDICKGCTPAFQRSVFGHSDAVDDSPFKREMQQVSLRFTIISHEGEKTESWITETVKSFTCEETVLFSTNKGNIIIMEYIYVNATLYYNL